MIEDVITYAPGLLFAFGFMGLNLLSPGPNILAVIGTAMTHGRRPAAALALGVATGSLLWACLTVAGLTALVSAYGQAMIILKLVGAAYLLWLAWKAFRNALSAEDADVVAVTQPSLWAYWRRGLTVIMTNPKAAFAWLALVALGIGADAPASIGLILIVGCTIMSVVGHLAYAIGFSTVPVVRTYLKARRFIQASLGVFFCFASYKLATAKV